MKLTISLLFVILLISSCQSEKGNSDKEEEVLNSKKYYSILIDKENRITQTYLSDASYEYNIRSKYYYNEGNLQKKIIEKEYKENTITDSVIFSYGITDTLRKEVSVRYVNGEVLREESRFDFFEKNKLTRSSYFDKSFNKYKGYIDTISFYSTYSYLSSNLQHKKEIGKYSTTVNNFYYEDDLLKKNIMMDEVKQDTLKVIDLFYEADYISKTIEKDYLEKTKLTSIYNKQGYLKESFWQGLNDEYDTVRVNFTDDENRIEYYWNKDFYPSFTLKTPMACVAFRITRDR
jgi:hypothetical protein